MTIAARGRKPDGKSEYIQSYEANSTEYSNTLTIQVSQRTTTSARRKPSAINT